MFWLDAAIVKLNIFDTFVELVKLEHIQRMFCSYLSIIVHDGFCSYMCHNVYTMHTAYMLLIDYSQLVMSTPAPL